jgi:hypothetical protein
MNACTECIILQKINESVTLIVADAECCYFALNAINMAGVFKESKSIIKPELDLLLKILFDYLISVRSGVQNLHNLLNEQGGIEESDSSE